MSNQIEIATKPHILYTCPQIQQKLQTGEGILFDEEKKEHYALVDFNLVEKFVPQSLYKVNI